MKCLQIPDEKLNIIILYVVPLMVPILSSIEHTEHIRYFVRSSV